ncbi:hypothetical protein RRF57_002449 [Xylaria bambusicola]|uniref:Uncharacterized protein n=1 Tax=Xylaria bambusicola TaxID=326684 RepID=A0AAN7USW6_9PEZI
MGSTTTARKRRLPSTRNEDESGGVNEGMTKPETSPKKRAKSKAETVNEEKRLRRFREKAPASFEVIYQRATEQRFYVLNRSRGGDPNCPEEDVEITGSTGNIYNVHIAQLPTCSCPHARKGNQCKHIIYPQVMSRVLRARADLIYQLALLSSELREIFQNAPPIEIGEGSSSSKAQDPNRKQIEGDCPICFTPFEAPEDTVYCRATCGQNMHKECFEMWAATKRQHARDVITCPMCRSPWQGDEDMVKKIKNTGIAGADGYVNVADQLGISGIRAHIMTARAVAKGIAVITALGIIGIDEERHFDFCLRAESFHVSDRMRLHHRDALFMTDRTATLVLHYSLFPPFIKKIYRFQDYHSYFEHRDILSSSFRLKLKGLFTLRCHLSSQFSMPSGEAGSHSSKPFSRRGWMAEMRVLALEVFN